jgi:hypothetical protein
MELVCIYIDEYKGIKNLFVNLNQNFICKLNRPHIHVEKQHCQFKEKYYRRQNIKLIIGKNGSGKTSILEFIEGAFNEILGVGAAIFWSENDSKYFIKSNSFSVTSLNGKPLGEFKSNIQTALLFVSNLFDLNKFAFNEPSTHKNNILKLSSNALLQKRTNKKDLLMAEVSRELAYAEYFNYQNKNTKTPLVFRFNIYTSNRRYFNNAIEKLTDSNVGFLLKNINIYNLVLEGLKNSTQKEIEPLEKVFKIDNISKEKLITPQIIRDALTKLLKQPKNNNIYSTKDAFRSIYESLIDDLVKKFSLRITDPSERAWFYVQTTLQVKLSQNELPEIIRDHIYKYSLIEKGSNIEDIIYETQQFGEFLEYTTQILLDNNVSIIHSKSVIYFQLKNIDLITNLTRRFNELNKYTDNFTFGWYGLSSGEEARLKLQSRIFSGVRELMSKGYSNIQLLIDEVDAYLHPEWQRKIVLDIIEILNNFEKPVFLTNNIKKVSVNTILTTHSPIILSDFLPDDIISIIKYENLIIQEKSNGFGARINDLYLDGMHLDSTFGEISRNEILRFYQELKQGELSNYSKYLINLIPDEKVKAYFMDENDKNK